MVCKLGPISRGAALVLALAMLGCPPNHPSLSSTETRIHLLDVGKGQIAELALNRQVEGGGEGGGQTTYSCGLGIAPALDQPISQPKAIFSLPAAGTGEPRAYILHSPGGTASFSAYRFQNGRYLHIRTGPVPHPGGSVLCHNTSDGWLLAVGSEAPFLLGYDLNPTGDLSLHPGLPELRNRPVGVSVWGDLLAVAEPQGLVTIYRLQTAQPAQLLSVVDLETPLVDLRLTSGGLAVLQSEPAALKLFQVGGEGMNSVPVASTPVVGTPLSLGIYSRETLLVTSTAPQALATFQIEAASLRETWRLVGVRANFQALVLDSTRPWPGPALFLAPVLAPADGTTALVMPQVPLYRGPILAGQYSRNVIVWQGTQGY